MDLRRSCGWRLDHGEEKSLMTCEEFSRNLMQSSGWSAGGSYPASYMPGEVVACQFKAPNPLTGAYEYYRLDQNGFPLEKYMNGQWKKAYPILQFTYPIGAGLVRRPANMVPAMSDQDKEQLALELAASNLFKPLTNYLTIGDETPGSGAIDFKSLLDEDTYSLLKQYLSFMPRQFLWDFFMQKIYPGIPFAQVYGEVTEGNWITSPIYGTSYMYKSYLNLVWMGFVDMFNVANLAFINETQMQPWDWENEKLLAYNMSQDQAALDEMRARFDEYNNVTLVLDPIAKNIMEQYASLPKLGDLGMEINRQNAVKELLKRAEYDSAQAIIDAFRYAKDTVLGPILINPIPKNIVMPSGVVLAEKSSTQ